jgi:hypothetical protein
VSEASDRSESEHVRDLCEATLLTNWREGVRERDGAAYAYTRPSPGHYPFQWYWDSCFTAISWRHFDAGRTRAELESLLSAQRDDGFIGHTIFWDTPLNERQRLTYNVVNPHDPMTASVQPPVLAWAWRIAIGDPSGVTAIGAHHDWLLAHRDLDGDRLIWIVQPDESGLDASPQFDAVWGPEAHGLPGFALLVEHNRHRGYDLRRVIDGGRPVVCEVMTNVIHALSLAALGRHSLTPTIIERMYDESAGLFRPLVVPVPRKTPTLTWASLSPLALPDLPESIGRRLVEQHLLDPERYWLPVPLPSVPAGDPSFERRESTLGIRRYWRGPTWVNSTWLVWLGLVRLGYQDQAGELARRLRGAVAASGLREYYDPYDGRGLGATSFGWSTLILELIDPDPRAGRSYLD